MITSLFRKSTPLNYSLIIISLLVFFFLYHISQVTGEISFLSIAGKFGLLLVICASLFAVNFIIKRNGLSKDSAYAALFMLLFFLFFPSVLNSPNLLLANFFVLLALRRLISLQSVKSTKEKIFDASLWIFAASLFHFWSILFIILVFISILLHASRDYRNWLIPFVAAFAVAMIFLFVAGILDHGIIDGLINRMSVDFRINYFTDINQNLALSIFVSIALFFTGAMIIALPAKPQLLQPSYKKAVISFFIGSLIWIISPDKSNDILIFAFAPLAFMATSHIEGMSHQIKQEITLAIFILTSLFLFFVQL